MAKVMTMTSTYDHRVIQGAESGAFLKRVDELLQGEDGFYDAVFGALGVETGRRGRRPDGGAARDRRPSRCPPPPTPAATAAPDEALLQAVQAATSVVKAHRMHGHLAARPRPARLARRAATPRSTRDGEPHARADGAHPGVGAARGRARRDVRRRPAPPGRDLLRHDRLRDRAHLGPQPARVAAPDDRVRRAPPAARPPRTSAPAARTGCPRSRRSRATCTRRSSARSSSPSRASTCWCRCSTRRSS